MRMYKPRKLLSLALLSWLCWSVPGLAAAAPPKPDVRVLIDISGSMKENDPQNLRVPALNLLVDLLPAGSKAGVWTFGMYVNMLVPHAAVDEAWRQQAKRQSGAIQSVALYTDIENALERATYDLQRDPAGYQRHLILLTDGLVDVSEARDPQRARTENQISRDHILYTMLPRLQEAGYTIHTVALSEGADQQLLQQLAQATGGLAAVAHSAEELMPLFVQVFDRSVPSEQVPLQDNRFLIDGAIEEFTVLVFHQPDSQRVMLTTPQGQRYTPGLHPETVRWHHSEHYDLITVKQPQEGEWRIETEEHPDNRVTVISDLQVALNEVPATLFQGLEQALQVHFTEEGRLIEREEFLRLLQVSAALAHQEQGELTRRTLTYAPHNPGYFEGALALDTLGAQSVVVRVDGKTFQRELVRPVRVLPLFEAEAVYQADNETFSHIRLHANSTDIDPARTQLAARWAGNGYPARLTPDGDWVIELDELDRSRTHDVSLFAKGTLQSGTPFDLTLPTLTIPPLAGLAASSPEVPEAVEEEVFMAPLPETPEPAATAPPEPEPEAPAPAEVPAASVAPVVTQPAQAGVSRTEVVLVGGVALGNILLFGVAFWLYRRHLGRQVQDELET